MTFCQLELPDHVLKQFEEGSRLRIKGYIGRFAPTPSGDMHLGNIRTALVSWLRARLYSGMWLLRLDDLDTFRNKPGSIERLQSDLLWLGLHWDQSPIVQSNRLGLYYSVLSALKRQGRLYPCRCSRKVLSRWSNKSIKSRIYPGTCRDLKTYWGIENRRLPSWRLRVNKEFVNTSGDIVLRRSDGLIAYHLATVIDELTLGISEVIRGNDLKAELCSQLAIIDSVYKAEIIYAHVPIMRDVNGKKLAKRNLDSGISSFRLNGINSSEIIGFLAASLNLVPFGSKLSSNELLTHLKKNKKTLNGVLL